MYGGANTTTPPAGWLWCNGGAVPPQYSNLISIIGNTLPDLRSRVPVGFGQGVGLSNYPTIFGSGGLETVTLTIDQIPSHTHAYDRTGQSFGWNINGGNGAGAQQPGSTTSSATGGGQSHENRQPYLVVNYIIKF